MSENIKLEYTSCCICEAEDSKNIFDLGEVKVVKCKRCGLIYNNPRYSVDSLNKYYRDHYYPKHLLHEVEGAVKNLNRDRFVWEKCISQIEYFMGRKDKLLDVGCGLGYFLKVAVEKGWKAVGIEPDAVAADFARNIFNLEIVTGTLSELVSNTPSQSFEVITYLQSFEHLPNPVAELEKIAYLLKPGGSLWLAVPNFNYLMIKLLGKNQFNIQNPTHLYHYTYSSIYKLLKKGGFKKIKRLIYFGGGRKKFGIAGQIIQGLSRAAGISSEIRIMATR